MFETSCELMYYIYYGKLCSPLNLSIYVVKDKYLSRISWNLK